MTNILIADDHSIVAEGISRLLPEGFCCCGIATTLTETAAKMAELHPDILILDIAMPDGDGVDAIPRLLTASTATRIIVLTMYAEPSVIRRSLDANIYGYLLKSTSAEEFLAALHSVANGQKYVSDEVHKLIATLQEIPPTLTPREREVLSLIVKGYSSKEIANRLCLAFETVHSYTKYIRQKLGCNNTASLVRIAIEKHLV